MCVFVVYVILRELIGLAYIDWTLGHPAGSICMLVSQRTWLLLSQKAASLRTRGINNVTLLNTDSHARHAYMSLKERFLQKLESNVHG